MTEQHAALAPASKHRDRGQIAVGIGVMLVALVMAVSTWHITADPMHPESGARLVPALCAAALGICGSWLVWEAMFGGWRNMAAASQTSRLQLGAGVWVTSGMLLKGLLITHIGFVLAASVGYVFVMQGLRRTAAREQHPSWRVALKDGCWGLVIACTVLAVFTKVLSVQLPVLMKAGWL